MTDFAQHLAALVGSRLCHDLISPIGAVGNGVEMISLDPRPRPAEVAMVSDSIAAANAKLRFFRIAFGIAGAEQTTTRMEVLPLLGDLYRSGRIAVDWQAPPELPRAEVKLAFLVLLCAEHSIPTGGNISVLRDDAAWNITAASPRLRHEAALWAVLAKPDIPAGLTPSHVQFPLAGLSLAALGRQASVDVAVSSLSVRF